MFSKASLRMGQPTATRPATPIAAHRRERLPKLEPHRYRGKRDESNAGRFGPVEGMAMILMVVELIVAVMIVLRPNSLVQYRPRLET
jgi:hypothetical protein